MGIHGLYPQIGPGTRISLAKLSSAHYTTASQPFRLAIDVSIWLFQIQSGKGGSNPALRTFYYRLLRLLTLNIHPLFVFDGPNKPLFKRNKRVGGPGVRVANVPEFLAKQLLKHFGFPFHIAPGEAEAECAVLQREGIVDAVLSEDVDTLMFGSGVTLRNWSSEGPSSKVPTHVNVFRAEETLAGSGLDAHGMVLVALMSGGDYLPDGIPGCGPKVACDAARAGFGAELCALRAGDKTALEEWKARLEREIKTNESKFFGRKMPSFNMPENFPNMQVLGYYIHPCVSTTEKLARLRESLKWDLPIDYSALRSFTADAFEWTCLAGAKKFIRNLAPAMLVRELRLPADLNEDLSEEAQEQRENELVTAIHGKRNHATTDGELEFRISYTPVNLVPIDLSIEEEDGEFLIAGGGGDIDSDAESEQLPADLDPDEPPMSPSKRRVAKPYDPSQLEKIWILKPLLQIGCPLLVECYEASLRDPKEFLKARRKAKAVTAGAQSANIHAPKATRKPRAAKKTRQAEGQENTLMAYTRVTKAGAVRNEGGKDGSDIARPRGAARAKSSDGPTAVAIPPPPTIQRPEEPSTGFILPSTRVPSALFRQPSAASSTHHADVAVLDLSHPVGSAPIRTSASPPRHHPTTSKRPPEPERTPRRKRRSPVPSTPGTDRAQRNITSFFSPSPHKNARIEKTFGLGKYGDVIDLISSPIEQSHAQVTALQSERLELQQEREITPTPPNVRFGSIRDLTPQTGPEDPNEPQDWPIDLPDTVTKRRGRKEPFSRSKTAPTFGYDGAFDVRAFDDDDGDMGFHTRTFMTPMRRSSVDGSFGPVAMDLVMPGDMVVDLTTPSPPRGNITRPSAQGGAVGMGRTLFRPCPLPQEQEPGDTDGLPTQLLLASAGARPTDTSSAIPPRQIPPLVASASVPPIIRHRASLAKPKKKKIQLRESLEGAWRAVDAEEVDLTGTVGGIRKTKKAWRMSTVEVLDLTGG